MTIVGVVRDTLQGSSLREPARRIVYSPLEQGNPPPRVTVAVRTTEPMSTFAAAARQEVRAISDEAVVDYVRTMEQQIDASLSRERVLATLSMWFSALALALTCIGLYGVLAYDVGRRRRDIGIRLALGARPGTVARSILAHAGLLVGVGVVAGAVVALAASRFLGGLLYGLGAADPLALVGGGAALAITALAASYLPARRASQISPAAVLRAE
jgi:ABC-type antimicrobial peptide transport system permease subunit